MQISLIFPNVSFLFQDPILNLTFCTWELLDWIVKNSKTGIPNAFAFSIAWIVESFLNWVFKNTTQTSV